MRARPIWVRIISVLFAPVATLDFDGRILALRLLPSNKEVCVKLGHACSRLVATGVGDAETRTKFTVVDALL